MFNQRGNFAIDYANIKDAVIEKAEISAVGISQNSLVNKDYVDNLFSAFPLKEPVRLATTTPLPSVSYSANVLTAEAFGALVVDGVAAVVGDRILISEQVDKTTNGIYDVTVIGDVATAFVLTRSSDFDVTAEIKMGTRVSVTSGNVKKGCSFAVIDLSETFALDAATPDGDMVFTQVGGVNVMTAGAGLVAVDYKYNIGDDADLDPETDPNGIGPTIQVEDDRVRINPNYLGQPSIVKTGALVAGGVSGARDGSAQFVLNALALGRDYITANGTIDLSKVFHEVDSSAGALTITLPEPTTNDVNREHIFINSNTTNDNKVTINLGTAKVLTAAGGLASSMELTRGNSIFLVALTQGASPFAKWGLLGSGALFLE